jgi:lipopolysaccharide export system protein LptC
MALSRPDNLHSRLVLWLKILLPLAALAVLSTLFLVSKNIRPEDAIPYAEIDIADLIKEPRLTEPNFAGMTSDGASLTLSAKEARLSAAGTPGAVVGLKGLLATPDGATTELAAQAAKLDASGRRVILSDGVTLGNSMGYRIEMDQMSVALDQTRLDSYGKVRAIGPVGSIEAASMHLGLAGSDPESYVLVFKGGVRMIYLPAKQGTGN